MKKYQRKKFRFARMVIKMPRMCHVANGKFWFFLPVPFMYDKWPFKEGERLMVTVSEADKR